MNKQNAIRLLGGVTTLVAMSAALLAVSGVSHGLAQADVAPVGKPVSYASDQADRGEEEYDDNCVDCHGDDLRGGLLGGPPLRGVAFEEKYANGSPAGVLFEVMSGTMPPNAPGSFSATTYADLMAYILKRNGFAAGAPLPSEVDALYELTIDK
jgi:mono/diheme cytochrome c family protein